MALDGALLHAAQHICDKFLTPQVYICAAVAARDRRLQTHCPDGACGLSQPMPRCDLQAAGTCATYSCAHALANKLPTGVGNSDQVKPRVL